MEGRREAVIFLDPSSPDGDLLNAPDRALAAVAGSLTLRPGVRMARRTGRTRLVAAVVWDVIPLRD